MKKSDLMNGDFVVLRSRMVGLVILNADDGYIVFDEKGGWEDLDNYDNDMVYSYDEDAIMQVYRGPRGFNELVDEPIFYERDKSWIGPIDEAYHQRVEEMKRKESEEVAQ